MKKFLVLLPGLIVSIILLCVGYFSYRNMQDIEEARREFQNFSNGIAKMFELMK